MKTIMKFCGIFDPIFIVFIGLALIFTIILKIYSQLKEARKYSKIYNPSEYLKTNGKIIEYEYENKETVIEKNGKPEKIIIIHAYPIVEYMDDNELKQFVYKTHFPRQTKENIGFEFPMYIKPNTKEPYIGFDDIYQNEIKNTKNMMIILSSVVGVLTIAMAICSAIVNYG